MYVGMYLTIHFLVIGYGHIRVCVMVHTHTRICGVNYYYGERLLLQLSFILYKRKGEQTTRI
jgi:hypothetical protein